MQGRGGAEERPETVRVGVAVSSLRMCAEGGGSAADVGDLL